MEDKHVRREMMDYRCRSCGASLDQTMVDLGGSPLANSYLTGEGLLKAEPHYPLTVKVCTTCWLAQLPECVMPQNIFSDYAYFSSYSDSWLKHCEDYSADIIKRLSLDSRSLVVELASNDGYLLQYFKKSGIPVLGVEPAKNVAEVAEQKGIPSWVMFFGTDTARKLVTQGKQADLLIGNNVLAHVPDLNDFIAGMKILLKPQGTLTMEFPHLLQLMRQNQFDTIYHEHYSYFSLLSVEQAFLRHGLVVFDVDELPTHGGSLRIHVRHAEDDSRTIRDSVHALKRMEREEGLTSVDAYAKFGLRVRETKFELLKFLIAAKEAGKRIVGYGAPAKGNTLLNYCGIRTDFIDYTVDRSPHKQGLYLPGSRIPILAPEKIFETKPDYVLILPWNLHGEIMEQMKRVREWNCQFVIPIPHVHTYP